MVDRLIGIRPLLAPEVLARWDSLAPLISAALEHDMGGLALSDVYTAIMQGYMQAWTDDANRAVVIAELLQYPQAQAAKVVILASDPGLPFKDWAGEMDRELERWARLKGCRWVEIQGRKGWEKVAPRFGWRHQYSVMVKNYEQRRV